METQKIQLNEKQFKNLVEKIVKQSVKEILSEQQIGGSSANGYRYDWTNGGVAGNQGGAFGANSLDIARDEEKFRQNQGAARQNGNETFYRQWCERNIEKVLDTPLARVAYKSGDYAKAYRAVMQS